MKKKWTAVVLAFVMMAFFFLSVNIPVYAEVLTDGDFEYTVTDGAATITDYIGTESDVVIPETLGGYPVTEIGERAFQMSDPRLTSVVIPDTVVNIGNSAFRNNRLTSLTLPASVISIGNDAFSSNDLTSVDLGEGLISIGNYAFDGNELTSLTVPDSVVSIGSESFRSNKLTELTIGSGLETIGRCAFEFNLLTSVVIPDNVITIGNSAFLENQITTVVIGDGVTTIGNYAFDDNQISSLTLGSSVEEIGSYAFRNGQLTEVTLPASLVSMGEDVFANNQITSVNIEDGVQEIGRRAFQANQLTSVVIPDSVTNMNRGAFEDNLLTDVTIGSGLQEIPRDGFRGNSLTTIILPANVTSIDWDAFNNNQLSSVYIHGDMADIGAGAFENNQETSEDLTIYGIAGTASETYAIDNNHTFINYSYLVTFKDYDGTILKEEIVFHGNDATAPSDPEREGYTFTGWDTSFTNVTEDLVVTAEYNLIDYTLTLEIEGEGSTTPLAGIHVFSVGTLYSEDFEDSDGNFIAENNVSNGWEWGTPVSWPESAASGVKCWGTNLTGSVRHNANYNLYSPVIDLSGIPEGTPLEVQWMHAVSNDSSEGGPYYHRAYAYYRVDDGAWQTMWTQDGSPVDWEQETFDISAAAGSTVQFRWRMTTDWFQWTSAPGYFVDDVEIVAGNPVVEVTASPATFWEFSHWVGDVLDSTSAETAVNVDGNKTITAHFTRPAFEVTFKDFDGSIIDEQTVFNGEGATAPTDPVREGYTFTGWDTEFAVITENLEINAQYEINIYDVIFRDWDGTELKAEQVEHGSDATPPATDPVRDNHEFTGWDKEYTNVTEHLEVTAQYNVNQYNISFNSNEGSAVDSITSDYGTTIAEPAAPAREGYDFEGWYKEAALINAWNFEADTVPSENITLYAKWTESEIPAADDPVVEDEETTEDVDEEIDENVEEEESVEGVSDKDLPQTGVPVSYGLGLLLLAGGALTIIKNRR